jgi:hypothetical protein
MMGIESRYKSSLVVHVAQAPSGAEVGPKDGTGYCPKGLDTRQAESETTYDSYA